ncbi:MAG: D-sedoheptulose 7-phosphate isomerase [Candidatus Aenigmatarchaeota archaeon]
MERALADIIHKAFDESARLKREFSMQNQEKILKVALVIAESFRKGNKLLLFGNGGSASDAQHIASEFVNRFKIERNPLPAIALTTDTSIITSIGNDYRFEDIFSRQIKAIGKEGDIAIAISTSGNSLNVIEGVRAARSMNITTVALTGRDGGELAKIVDFPLIVNSFDTPRIQEVHITTGHILCELVDKVLFEMS